MGCLFAGGLASAGCGVSLLQRHKPSQNTGMVTIDSANDSNSYRLLLEDKHSARPIDHLLVCTKANDIAAAVADIAHRVAPDAPIVVAANGMGYLADISLLLPANTVYCCLSTDGAYQLEPLHIRYAGRGSNLIGSPSGLPEPGWLQDWRSGFLDVGWSPDIRAAQWHKLAINCAINPLTALNRCRNGELARTEKLRKQVSQLCEEIAAISTAAGFTCTAASLREDVMAVIENTAQNRSSMLQDVLAGRKTEIEFINGHMLRTARRLDVDAPLNQELLQEVIALAQ